MIEKGYVLQMARYNAWQNSQLRQIVQQMDEADLTQERGAFFGSVFGTLNHLLWGDLFWMSQWCSDIRTPEGDGAASVTLTPTAGAWDAERFRMDGRIRIWAQTLSNVDLAGAITWTSTSRKTKFTQNKGLCVAHMFNHQCHHRGQVSQMLHAAGISPPQSDLVFMPEEF